MKMLITGATVALSMLIGTSAFAAKPVPSSDINCDTLRAAIDTVDTYLDTTTTSFGSLGDLIAKALVQAPQTGDFLVQQLNYVYNGGTEPLPYLGFSQGDVLTTPFTSTKQVISTIATCGDTKFLIDQIND